MAKKKSAKSVKETDNPETESPAKAPARSLDTAHITVRIKYTPAPSKGIFASIIWAVLFGVGAFYVVKSVAKHKPGTHAAVLAFARSAESVVPRPGTSAHDGSQAGGPLPLERPSTNAEGRVAGGETTNFITLPFGQLPGPELNPIPDGPVPAMLQEADDYAAQHPDDFRAIIDRYRQVLTAAQGTDWEQSVNVQLQFAMGRHEEALRKAIDDYQQKMMAQLQARQPQAAYDVWKTFPQNLRTPQSDQEIADILGRNLPQGIQSR